MKRETLEETGLRIQPTTVVGLTNDIFPELEKHYVTVFMGSAQEDATQEPQVRESCSRICSNSVCTGKELTSSPFCRPWSHRNAKGGCGSRGRSCRKWRKDPSECRSCFFPLRISFFQAVCGAGEDKWMQDVTDSLFIYHSRRIV